MKRDDFDVIYRRLSNVYSSFGLIEKKEAIWGLFKNLEIKYLSDFINHIVLLQDEHLDIYKWVREKTAARISYIRTNKLMRDETIRLSKIDHNELGRLHAEAGTTNLWELVRKKINAG